MQQNNFDAHSSQIKLNPLSRKIIDTSKRRYESGKDIVVRK